MAGLALVRARPGGAGERALRHAHQGRGGGRRVGAARWCGHAGREVSAHAVRVDGRAPGGEVLFRAQRPEERQGAAAMGDRALAGGGFPRPGAAAPRRGAGRREGVRRGAEAARCAACSRLRRSIRGAQGRRAGGEEPARRGPRGLPERAREGRAARQPVPRERAHAARGARRLTMFRRILAAGAALLAACSSPSGPKPAALEQLSDPRSVRLLWSANVGRADRFTFFPALVGDSVYAAARDGTLARFDMANGEERWRTSVETRLSSGVGADLRTAAVATEAGEVIAVDTAKGEVRWRARVSSEVLAPPRVGNGLVLVRSADSRIFAFGEDDGKRRWVYQRAPSSLIVRSPAGVTLLGDLAFAGFPGGKLTALALGTGSAIAVGDLEGYVHFLARDSGAFVARFATGGGAIRNAPVALPSGLLVQTQNGGLFALAL